MTTQLAHRIRDHRRSLDQTQGEAAQALKVTQQTVAAWEAGKRPSPQHFDNLARYLGLTHDEVLKLVFTKTAGTSDLETRVDQLTSQVSDLAGLVQTLVSALQEQPEPTQRRAPAKRAPAKSAGRRRGS